jgi:hypothetical protein
MSAKARARLEGSGALAEVTGGEVAPQAAAAAASRVIQGRFGWS